MPGRMTSPAALAAKIQSKSVPITESGCWIWGGAVTDGGYGKLKYRTRWTRAHRASYEIFGNYIHDSLGAR